MCGIFGFYAYGEPLKKYDVESLISSLGHESCVRGTDATGIAYVVDNKIEIHKAAKAACDFKFRLPDKVSAIIGHTRFTTQGHHKFNENNHPFLGQCKKSNFALAHNGVLHDDLVLRKKHKLPQTKIKTDSYIAVQLLERNKELTFGAVKDMCEVIEGSFCFSILSDKNELFLVKGSNPLIMVHHKDLQVYIYASTEEILWKAIITSNLFKYFNPSRVNNQSAIEEINLHSGDIYQLRANGETMRGKFAYNEYISPTHFTGRWPAIQEKGLESDSDMEYVKQLKMTAVTMGTDDEIIDYLLMEGYGFDEIAELLYEGSYDNICKMM